MYMCTQHDMDSVSIGSEMLWQWATSSVLSRPAPDTELLLVNEKDHRSVRVRVESASCGLINGNNIKERRRASGTMTAYAVSKVNGAAWKPAKKKGRERNAAPFSANQADVFIAV